MDKIHETISSIRSKPESVRRNILHSFMIILSVILIGLWIYSLGVTFSDPSTKEGLSEDIETFSGFKDSAVNSYETEADNSVDFYLE